MRFTGGRSAHLACEAIPIKDVGPDFLRNLLIKGRSWNAIEQEVLSGLEIAPIIVGEDLIALDGSEFSDASRPFALVPCGEPEFFGSQNRSHIRKKIRSQSRPSTFSSHAQDLPQALTGTACRRVKAVMIRCPTAFATGGGKAFPTCR